MSRFYFSHFAKRLSVEMFSTHFVIVITFIQLQENVLEEPHRPFQLSYPLKVLQGVLQAQVQNVPQYRPDWGSWWKVLGPSGFELNDDEDDAD